MQKSAKNHQKLQPTFINWCNILLKLSRKFKAMSKPCQPQTSNSSGINCCAFKKST